MIRHAVLADTGPLYAAVDPSDQYHSRAHEELLRLAQGGFTVLVAWPLLAETYTLILRRLGHHAALSFVDELLTTSIPVNPEPSDYVGAARRLESPPGYEVTLFDSVLAELSIRLELPVWTYDSDFEAMSVSVWS